MKKAILTLMSMILVTSFSEARTEKLYLINLTGKNFTSKTFNLMDDGISGDFDDFGLKLDGEFGRDFFVEGKASNPKEKCSVQVVKKTTKMTIFKLIDDLEIDGGETCTLRFTYRNKITATIEFFKEGT